MPNTQRVIAKKMREEIKKSGRNHIQSLSQTRLGEGPGYAKVVQSGVLVVKDKAQGTVSKKQEKPFAIESRRVCQIGKGPGRV